jgi:hypothetical protein
MRLIMYLLMHCPDSINPQEALQGDPIVTVRIRSTP